MIARIIANIRSMFFHAKPVEAFYVDGYRWGCGECGYVNRPVQLHCADCGIPHTNEPRHNL